MMPKCKTTALTRSQQLDQMTRKNGYKPTMYEAHGVYRGHWKNDMKNGKGTMIYNNSTVYVGDWRDNKRHGVGVLTKRLSDCDVMIYEGEWFNNQFIKGRWYGKNGIYEGEYMPGTKLKCGYGTMRWNDGSVYSGFWSNNKYHGKGLLVEANGNYYDGYWNYGLKHGKGIYMYRNRGQKMDGVWVDGVPKVSTIIDFQRQNALILPTIYPIPKISSCDLEVLDNMYKTVQSNVLDLL
ncbi:MORN repeat-containing protein 3-like [Adelges cooleyi]|uniref:MORN repeat-containing protein 3-like n=1 Tax=Adelges cooleyi TaxID=133065 RepID=UPI00217FCBD9|nr:MORN repeat-containing protein 3-like [Adelges cooleyi]